MQAAFAVCIDTGRENGGGFQRGTLPPWHTTFGESLVCYTFCPGWRGKGAARSGADAFPHQKISLRNGASAIISRADFGRGERYIKPSSSVPPQRCWCCLEHTRPGMQRAAFSCPQYRRPRAAIQMRTATRPGGPQPPHRSIQRCPPYE